MTLVPSYRSVLGIAKEATEGTAAVPTAFFRPTDLKPAVKQVYLDDTGMRGSMAKTYDQVQGPYSTEYEIDGDLHVDEIGWPLAGLLADLTVTGAADPYSTTFSLLNSGQGQPPSYTLTDYNGNNARAFAGCRFSDLAVKYTAAGLVTYTAKAVGRSFAVGATPTPSFPAYPALPSWRATVSLAGSTAALVTDVEVDLKRTVQAVAGLGGSQAPVAVYADADLECTGSLTVVYDTTQGETVYSNYLNGTKVILVVDLTNGTRELKFTMSQTQIDDATLNRGSGKYAELACKFTAQANTTDVGTSGGYSPVKALTQSGVAAGTYA